MKFNILHMYPNIMNLYGEHANVLVLKDALIKQDFEVIVDTYSLNEKVDFKKYDLIYIGSGTEQKQELIISDLISKKEEIKEYIESGKLFISTGNSHEIFGKYILLNDSVTKLECLDIFGYYTIREEKRISTDLIFKFPKARTKIVGYTNRVSNVYNIPNYLFSVTFGIGSNKATKEEGYNYLNFFGTYVIGPLFVKNPDFLKYVIKIACKNKEIEFKDTRKKDDNDYAKFAYVNTLKELEQRVNKSKKNSY